MTLTPFTFPATGQQIRVIGDRENPLIHHADACSALEHTNPSVALRMIDEDERIQIDMRSITADQTALNFSTPGTGNAKAWFLTEPGFYTLALRSKAPRAKEFRRWITHEVLPAIRRTGGYSVERQAPRTYAEALRELADEHEARAAAEARAAELAPAADAWNTLADAQGDYALREAAQILDRDPAITTGQNRLAAYLRRIGWCDAEGEPYQRHVDAGRLVRRARTYLHPRTGEEQATTQTRITAKGLRELRDRLAGEAQAAIGAGA